MKQSKHKVFPSSFAAPPPLSFDNKCMPLANAPASTLILHSCQICTHIQVYLIMGGYLI